MKSELEKKIDACLTFICEALGKAILLTTIIAGVFEATHWISVLIARQFY